MTNAERQNAEIATIRDRDIKISLSDADVRRLWEMAAKAGLTAGKLLASFVGDLVGGTYTNGSDERMCARNWFERCGFSWLASKTLLRYLVEFGELDAFVDAWRLKEAAGEELADCKAQAEIEELERDTRLYQSEMDIYFEQFVEWFGDAPHGSCEEEAAKVLAWYDSLVDAGGVGNEVWIC